MNYVKVLIRETMQFIRWKEITLLMYRKEQKLRQIRKLLKVL